MKTLYFVPNDYKTMFLSRSFSPLISIGEDNAVFQSLYLINEHGTTDAVISILENLFCSLSIVYAASIHFYQAGYCPSYFSTSSSIALDYTVPSFKSPLRITIPSAISLALYSNALIMNLGITSKEGRYMIEYDEKLSLLIDEQMNVVAFCCLNLTNPEIRELQESLSFKEYEIAVSSFPILRIDSSYYSYIAELLTLLDISALAIIDYGISQKYITEYFFNYYKNYNTIQKKGGSLDIYHLKYIWSFIDCAVSLYRHNYHTKPFYNFTTQDLLLISIIQSFSKRERWNIIYFGYHKAHIISNEFLVTYAIAGIDEDKDLHLFALARLLPQEYDQIPALLVTAYNAQLFNENLLVYAKIWFYIQHLMTLYRQQLIK